MVVLPTPLTPTSNQTFNLPFWGTSRSIPEFFIGLSIINLKKSEPKPVNGSAQGSSENNSEQNSTTEANNAGQQILYYKIPVEYEIRGNFLSYLKFRRALSKSSKVIKLSFSKNCLSILDSFNNLFFKL